MLECFNLFFAALRKRLYAPVIEIPNVTVDLVPRRGPLGKESEANPLNQTPNEKLSSDHHLTQRVETLH
jgi:hypothetical protein